MALASLVLGIIATILSLSVVGFFLGIPVGLVAIVLGVLARKRAVMATEPTGTATAGLSLGVVGVVVGLTLYAACTWVTRHTREEFDRLARDRKVQPDNREFEDTFHKMLAPKHDGGSD